MTRKQDPPNLLEVNRTLTIRPVTPEDEDFLYRVYTTTREEELAVTGWSEVQKEEFLKQQFSAQHSFYQEHFREAEFHIILLNDEPIGRLYLDRRQEEFRLIDLALLPEHRGQGIGTFFLKDVLDQARQAGLPVRIHVEHFNPALRLYTRLGFRQIDENGVYHLMEWSPCPVS